MMYNKAIVIGGSIAGKLAAKVLSEFYKEVTILEAGEKWDGVGPIKRVPQAQHPHVLLKSGVDNLKMLFPDILIQLKKSGGIVGDFTRDLKWWHFGEVKQPFKGKIALNQQSRGMLESYIQKRTLEIPNINVCNGMLVQDLIIDKKQNRISGVKAKCLETGKQQNIYANMVIDASGCGSCSTKWLQGYNIDVKEEKIDIQLTYSTQMFQLKKDESINALSIYAPPSYPQNPYGALIQKIEKNQYFLTYCGYAGEVLPRNDKEFNDFAKKMPIPDFTDFLQKAEAITDVKNYRVPYQFQKRFDLVKNMPSGFLVIGDAHTRFDPVFGQGMSVIAMTVIQLRQCLQQRHNTDQKFTRIFYKRIAKIIETPWEMTKTEIFRHPKFRGKLTFVQNFQQWYTKKVYEVSASNREVYERLVRVMNLVCKPTHLLHPKVWIALLLQKR